MTEKSQIPRPVSQEDLDLFYSKVDGSFRSHQRLFTEELELHNSKVEALEQQLATVTVGFAEQAVLIEALLFQLQYENEERQKSFQEKVMELRAMMLETLEYTSDVMENGNPEPEEPMENVATEN